MLGCSKYIFASLIVLTAGCSGEQKSPSYESLVCYDPSKQEGVVEFVNASRIFRDGRDSRMYFLTYLEEDGSSSAMVYLQREGEACTILDHDTPMQDEGASLTVQYQSGREGFGT